MGPLKIRDFLTQNMIQIFLKIASSLGQTLLNEKIQTDPCITLELERIDRPLIAQKV